MFSRFRSIGQIHPLFRRIHPQRQQGPILPPAGEPSNETSQQASATIAPQVLVSSLDAGLITAVPSPPIATDSASADLALPTELLLHCFSFMSLKALIISRSVCSEWRRLVPLSDLLPVRRRLLELYDTVINSPYFLDTRPWTLDNLQPFDRRHYVETLLHQYDRIPDDFYLWILEWPGRVVIRCLWPGLPFVNCQTQNIERQRGINFLGKTPPQISAVIHKYCSPVVEFVPALLLWRGDIETHWLMFDPRSKFFGRVFVFSFTESGGIIPYFEDEEEDAEYLVFDDFIIYQERLWEQYGGAARSCFLNDWGAMPADPHNDAVVQPTNDTFSDDSYQDVPAPPWTRRKEPQFQERLFAQ